MTKFFIYGLVDPRNWEIRYIGLTTKGYKRPRQHGEKTQLKGEGNTHKANWIRSLHRANLDYWIIVLEWSHSGELLPEKEQWWISEGRERGWPLTNLTDGGEGKLGWVTPEETRSKLSESRRKWYSDPENREATAEANRALADDPGWREATAAGIRARSEDPNWQKAHAAANHARARKYFVDGRWWSMRELAEETGRDESTIRRRLAKYPHNLIRAIWGGR